MNDDNFPIPERGMVRVTQDYDKHSIEQRMPLEQTLVKFRESVLRMTKDSVITAYSQDALELLTLMTRYDCRPSEIVGIVRLKDNVEPSLYLGNYRNKIVDIKINKKD